MKKADPRDHYLASITLHFTFRKELVEKLLLTDVMMLMFLSCPNQNLGL